MKEEIIKIIGFGIEPERAELMADEIIKLQSELNVDTIKDVVKIFENWLFYTKGITIEKHLIKQFLKFNYNIK